MARIDKIREVGLGTDVFVALQDHCQGRVGRQKALSATDVGASAPAE